MARQTPELYLQRVVRQLHSTGPRLVAGGRVQLARAPEPRHVVQRFVAQPTPHRLHLRLPLWRVPTHAGRARVGLVVKLLSGAGGGSHRSASSTGDEGVELGVVTVASSAVQKQELGYGRGWTELGAGRGRSHATANEVCMVRCL